VGGAFIVWGVIDSDTGVDTSEPFAEAAGVVWGVSGIGGAGRLRAEGISPLGAS
jgi:hypothetical protein